MNKRQLLKNNKGVALVSIMICVAFIAVIASALLVVTYTNFEMKVMNLRSKENFYETDGQLTRITTLFRYNMSDAGPNSTETDMDKRLKAVCMDGDFGAESDHVPVAGEPGFDPTNLTKTVKVSSGVYNVKRLASLAWEEEDVNKNARMFDGPVANSAKALGYNQDSFYYTSSDSGVIKKTVDGNITTYELSDFQITQENTDGYTNTVDTHIVFRTKKFPGTGNVLDPGGVGSCSGLLDGSITADTNNANFACIDVYGNSYFGSYGGVEDWDGGRYTSPGKYTDNKMAMNLAGESKMNLIGDVVVVFGDIYLSGNSCLYVNGGKLKVFGDIVIKDNATLVCSGTIMMAEDPLPGRTEATSIKCLDVPSANPNKHLYPKTLANDTAIKRIKKDDVIVLLQVLGLQGDSTADDGFTNQVIQPINHEGTNNKSFDLRKSRFEGNHEEGSTAFYGSTADDKIGVIFWNEDNMQNTMAANRLVFNSNPGLTIKSSQVSTTIISPYPIKLNHEHSVSLTCLGPEAFKYLAGYKYTDKTKTGYNTDVHAISVEIKPDDGSNKVSAKLSAGDFFSSVDEVNEVVNTILGIGEGDASGSKPTYKTSLSFTDYKKDYK